MLRWFFLLVTVVAFAAAFRATTASALGWSLLVGFVAMTTSFFGFLAARVGSVSRGQHSREIALLVTSGPKKGGGPAQAGAGSRPAPAHPVAGDVGMPRQPHHRADDDAGQG